jgi:glycosyltransferase involved in cell wall biosynthesis
MNEPLISVILPTYNCRDYICEAIDTILKQSYKNIEIIVVDSSTDDTKQLLERYQERITYFYQKPSGVSAARNLGLKHARGALVAFQDADDRWLPQKLAKQVAALKGFPDAKVVFTDYLTFDHTGIIRSTGCWPHFTTWIDRQRVQGTDTAYGQLYWELMLGNCIGTCSALVTKEVLDECNGFDETFKTCEDLDLWLRITARYNMLYIDEVLAEYRVRSNGLSGSLESRNLTWGLDQARVREKHIRNNLVPSDLRSMIEKLQGKHCWELGLACLDGGEHEKAREMFLTGIRYRPLNWVMRLYFALTFLPPSLIASGKRVKHAIRDVLPSSS